MPLAQVVERERCLAAYLFEYICGEKHTTGFAFRLYSCSHVHAIAEDIIIVDDDIAHVNADSEYNAGPTIDLGGIAIRHRVLHRNRTIHGIDSAGELHQH